MSEFPLFLYIYDLDGMHGGPLDIPTELGLEILMHTAIKPAVKEGREVVITDCLDYCVFHAKDGKVIFPEPRTNGN